MSALPDVSEALDGFGEMVELTIVRRGPKNFKVTTVKEEPVTIYGVVVPLDFSELQLRQENQRTWNLAHLYTEESILLDSLLQDTDGVTYLLMSAKRWGSYNEYDMREAPQS